MKKIFKTLPFFVFLTPLIAFAATFNNAAQLFDFFTGFINQYIIPFLIALAVVYFLWGAGTFIRNAEDTNARTEGKMFMIYGIIGLFVIVAFWGIVQILMNTFSINSAFPRFPSSSPTPYNDIYGNIGTF
ncbi:MAG: hypothetical protein AAB488_00265 [Patescibacteria group bacterium]